MLTQTKAWIRFVFSHTHFVSLHSDGTNRSSISIFSSSRRSWIIIVIALSVDGPLFLLPYNVLSRDWTSAVPCSTSWLGSIFGAKVGGTEDKSEWQRSFTASSNLTSPLSSPSCSSSSACLESSVLHHITLTAATRVGLPRSHLPFSYAPVCLNQPVYTWSPVWYKTYYVLVCFLTGAEWECVFFPDWIYSGAYSHGYWATGIEKTFDQAGQASHCCTGAVNADWAPFPKRWFLCVFLSLPILPHC